MEKKKQPAVSERTPLKARVCDRSGLIIRDYNLVTDLDSSRHSLEHENSLAGALEIGGEGLPLSNHDSEHSIGGGSWKSMDRAARVIVAVMLTSMAFMFFMACKNEKLSPHLPRMAGAWSAIALPFSTESPATLGMTVVKRPSISSPGPIFGDLVTRQPLPTNSWCENFFLGKSNNGPDNKVFQVPYILDTAGHVAGVRTHPAHVQSNDRAVMMTYELENGVSLGAVESFLPQHEVVGEENNAIARLAIVLRWMSQEFKETGVGSMMTAPIVRGSPYTSMQYTLATPRIHAARSLSGALVIDGDKTMECGQGHNQFSATPVLVEREIKVQFDTSDMTWLIFVSEPTEFVCSNTAAVVDTGSQLPPGVIQKVNDTNAAMFELRATAPMKQGMVRIAMANNCTTGQNPQYCEMRRPRDQTAYTQLLRAHSDIYPTGKADIRFTFPVQSEEEEELRLNFNWAPASMKALANADPTSTALLQPPGRGIPAVELLMFATPHHQERIRPISSSSNVVMKDGCMPTIHGTACPVTGGSWSLVEHLHRTSFSAPRAARPELLPLIKEAIQKDIDYEIPLNYQRGAGDTYFAGKMLAKLARILIIADEISGVEKDKFDGALARLRSGTEIWLNGSAASPLLYDKEWGGVVSCGCDFNGDTQGCHNSYPDCPALVDAGQNFGAGFYNDHHYHYGYHIYAAAVLAKFDPLWGRQFFQHVLLLIRDIANPSANDPHFPTFRHKDWYLGFSWASGVVTIQGNPYPNGRNQESSSEAVAAYESVALFGEVMANIYAGSDDPEEEDLCDAAERVRDMGRLLMATEVRSAKTYWHVQSPEAVGVSRIYPVSYKSKVVGMLWSMLAQEQTWFGNEPWKSYGIQLMPLTTVAEQRDSPSWVAEMLPYFTLSCSSNPSCEKDGWSVLVMAMQATLGQWESARDGIMALSDDVFEAAGGNGHSRTNSLWYIATRPDPGDFQVGTI